ncbi:MAG: DUF47 family protein [Candidatus Omnitrophica bacterium]|nr:DUF47 family protein [Candidatus Omnitrophota bacterium]
MPSLKEPAMIFNFFPQEFNFFDLFEKQVNCAVEAARYFKELVLAGGVSEASLSKMHQIEHDADEAAHDIIKQLNKSFITPFDREDIYALTKELDDVVDMIYTIVSRLKVYKISGVNKNIVEFASLIEQSVAGVSCAVKAMRNMKNSETISESCVEVNRLENVGDAMRDSVLGELFEKEKDPIMVIKLKEIYEDAETILDICEDVVHVVESILVKQA